MALLSASTGTFPFTKITYLPADGPEGYSNALVFCPRVTGFESQLEHRLSCGGFVRSLQANSITLSPIQQGKEIPAFSITTISALGPTAHPTPFSLGTEGGGFFSETKGAAVWS